MENPPDREELHTQRLSGVFEVKIFRDEWSVQSLRAASYREPDYHQRRSPSFHHFLSDRDTLSLQRVDFDKLRHLVSAMDENEIAARRRNLVHVYHEAIHDAEESLKGISFTRMLILLAHYRLIADDSALQCVVLLSLPRNDVFGANPSFPPPSPLSNS